MPHALALFTGSLDSMLAVRAIQEQGFAVEALHVRTLFGCGHGNAAEAAEMLKVSLTTLEVEDEYLDVFRRPRFGFGPAKNPCVDCRVHLGRMACRRMKEIGAKVVISGEILGQRVPGQRRKDLEVIARHSGLEGQWLRPLSARLLPETDAERSGLIDRRRLFAFHGSGRRELIELAKRWGFSSIPAPSNGCTAAQKHFAALLADLLAHEPAAQRADFELLCTGRHIRFDKQTKIVLGRNAAENALLRQFAEQSFAIKRQPPPIVLLEPKNYAGPSAIVTGNASDAISEAARLISHPKNPEKSEIMVADGRENRTITAKTPKKLPRK